MKNEQCRLWGSTKFASKFEPRARVLTSSRPCAHCSGRRKFVLDGIPKTTLLDARTRPWHQMVIRLSAVGAVRTVVDHQGDRHKTTVNNGLLVYLWTHDHGYSKLRKFKQRQQYITTNNIKPPCRTVQRLQLEITNNANVVAETRMKDFPTFNNSAWPTHNLSPHPSSPQHNLINFAQHIRLPKTLSPCALSPSSPLSALLSLALPQVRRISRKYRRYIEC